MTIIEKFQDESIRRSLRRYGISEIWLYGSMAHGDTKYVGSLKTVLNVLRQSFDFMWG